MAPIGYLFGGIMLVAAGSALWGLASARWTTYVWHQRMAALGFTSEGSYPTLSAKGRWRDTEVEVWHVATQVGKSVRVAHYVKLWGRTVGPPAVTRLLEGGHPAQLEGREVSLTGDGVLSPAALYVMLELAAESGPSGPPPSP